MLIGSLSARRGVACHQVADGTQAAVKGFTNAVMNLLFSIKYWKFLDELGDY
jgi:hypothetical protein